MEHTDEKQLDFTPSSQAYNHSPSPSSPPPSDLLHHSTLETLEDKGCTIIAVETLDDSLHHLHLQDKPQQQPQEEETDHNTPEEEEDEDIQVIESETVDEDAETEAESENENEKTNLSILANDESPLQELNKETIPNENGTEESPFEKISDESDNFKENQQQQDENPEENENPEEETVPTDGNNGKFQYPIRPGEPDCSYYLRTGTCRYGLNCRFNHPTRRKRLPRSPPNRSPSSSAEPVQVGREKDEYPERTGQQECKYYLRTGGCKYGKACRYDHPREKSTNDPPAEFNFLGLPMRPGERECPFYMRTGSCKFALNCRFHHPDPTATGGSDSGYSKSGSIPLHSSGESQQAVASWSLPRSSNPAAPYLDTSPSYVPVMLPPPQGLHSSLEWNGYQASPVMPLYPPKGNVRQPMASPPMPTVLNDSTKVLDGFTYHQQMPVDEFPERPGQKECQYFLKTGDCKYKSACRFHHPKNRAPKTLALSPMGLPLRPDQIVCSHYSRYGICKFGSACKYDHPPNYGTPTFPVGSMSGPSVPFDNSVAFGGPNRGDGSTSLVQQSV